MRAWRLAGAAAAGHGCDRNTTEPYIAACVDD
jgi:hypothetical protein